MRNFTILMIAILPVFAISSCKDDDTQPTEEELKTQALLRTWSVGTTGSVQLDGTPKNEWKDFTLTLTDKAFTSNTVNESIWPASGTWNFDKGNLNRIARNDGVVMDLHLSDTILILDFAISQSSVGRPRGISGQYKFTLTKK